MPTYAYRCIKCDHEFEAFHKITAHPRSKRCPLCGGRASRVISGGAGFLFKGEGFYTTDYRSEEYRTKAKAEKDTAPAKSDSGEPAAKAEAAAKADQPVTSPAKKKRKKGTA